MLIFVTDFTKILNLYCVNMWTKWDQLGEPNSWIGDQYFCWIVVVAASVVEHVHIGSGSNSFKYSLLKYIVLSDATSI